MNLLSHLRDCPTDTLVHRDLFICAKQIQHCIVRISMRRDKVDRDLICRGMFQKVIDPGCSSSGRPSNTQSGIDALQSAGCVIVEFKVRSLPRYAAPEIDVRLVPDFEVPGCNLIDTVTVNKVLCEVGDQSIPPL